MPIFADADARERFAAELEEVQTSPVAATRNIGTLAMQLGNTLLDVLAHHLSYQNSILATMQTAGKHSVAAKRVYDAPSARDGTRILVDRLWPRGMSKGRAKIDRWAKDIAPSSELRAWFHEDPERRYRKFKVAYRKELPGNRAAVRAALQGRGRVTLLTAARDLERSHLPTLPSFISKLR